MTSLLDAFPDLDQAKVERQLPNGRNLCAPTAASNALSSLIERGKLNLRDIDLDKQEALALTLTSEDFMNSVTGDGTSPHEFLHGLDAFLSRYTTSNVSLKYLGWRTHPSKYHGGSEVPDLDFVNSLNEESGIWLNIGWYQSISDCSFERKGGHWVTLVGYDFADTETAGLYIHDPGTKGLRKHERVTVNVLTSGTLQGNYTGLPRSANQYLRLGGDLTIPSNRIAILDGIVVLTTSP
jgi:hypothetical protein